MLRVVTDQILNDENGLLLLEFGLGPQVDPFEHEFTELTHHLEMTLFHLHASALVCGVHHGIDHRPDPFPRSGAERCESLHRQVVILDHSCAKRI